MTASRTALRLPLTDSCSKLRGAMLGHALMAFLLGVHDEEHAELDNENAPARYLSFVSSETYITKKFCRKCDSDHVVKHGTENRPGRTPGQRWHCRSCNYRWVTPLGD